MSAQVVEGKLDEIPLPNILRELYLRRVSGILDLFQSREQRRIILDEGEVRTARSNRMEHRIGQFALKSGAISRVQLLQAISSDNLEIPFGQRLIHLGYISADVLKTQLDGMVREIITECIGWDSGDYRFKQGRAAMEEETEIRMSTADIIYHGFRAHATEQMAQKMIGDLDATLVPNPNLRLLFQHISLEPGEQQILGVVDGTTTTSQLIASLPGEAADNIAVLASLVAAGLIIALDEDADSPPLPYPSLETDDAVAPPSPDDSEPLPTPDEADPLPNPDEADPLPAEEEPPSPPPEPTRPPRRPATTGPPRRAATTPAADERRKREMALPQPAATPVEDSQDEQRVMPRQQRPAVRPDPGATDTSRPTFSDVEIDRMRISIRQKYAILSSGDHYRLLGLPYRATQREIFTSFNNLCMLFHPDLALQEPFSNMKHQLEAIFSRLEEAYNTLVDEDERQKYDTLNGFD